MNELYWFILLILNFAAIMVAFRFWGKLGLYLWIPIYVIVANLQVAKTVNLFGIEATLGNIVYATGFLATDILSECYGRKASSKAVPMGFFALIVMTVFMQMAILFIPAPSDYIQQSMKELFGLMPRIAAASLIAYLCSNSHDIWAFEFWKARFPSTRMLWLRNNASTFVSQLIDTVIFTLGAFLGVYPWDVLIQIMISTYLLKWIVAICDTPFIYLARRWFDQGKISCTL
ncbi:MAG: queuosine precursor transporter [Spirochaetia bacterium]|jgi:uncharacterized integral membrane protein (TIGR00697 family)|nr:queuosine precursor transporter [Spirochaetia bacterium]